MNERIDDIGRVTIIGGIGGITIIGGMRWDNRCSAARDKIYNKKKFKMRVTRLKFHIHKTKTFPSHPQLNKSK